jgi:hypothetical protein
VVASFIELGDASVEALQPGLIKLLQITQSASLIKGHFTHETESPVTSTLHALSLVVKGGAGPSSLPTTLEGPTEYVNAR